MSYWNIIKEEWQEYLLKGLLILSGVLILIFSIIIFKTYSMFNLWESLKGINEISLIMVSCFLIAILTPLTGIKALK